jgi:hypothetical protein
MILEILFALAFLIFLVCTFIEYQANKLENDLIESMEQLAIQIEYGNSIETALVMTSKLHSYAARIYRRVIKKMNNGLSLTNAFKSVTTFHRSRTLAFLSNTMGLYDTYGLAISSQLRDSSLNLLKLRRALDEMYEKTAPSIRVMQIIALFGSPILTVFLSGILDLPIYTLGLYFAGLVVIVYGMFDYLIYSNVKRTIFMMPLLVTGYLMVLNWLAPYIADFFIYLF